MSLYAGYSMQPRLICAWHDDARDHVTTTSMCRFTCYESPIIHLFAFKRLIKHPWTRIPVSRKPFILWGEERGGAFWVRRCPPHKITETEQCFARTRKKLSFCVRTKRRQHTDIFDSGDWRPITRNDMLHRCDAIGFVPGCWRCKSQRQDVKVIAADAALVASSVCVCGCHHRVTIAPINTAHRFTLPTLTRIARSDVLDPKYREWT